MARATKCLYNLACGALLCLSFSPFSLYAVAPLAVAVAMCLWARQDTAKSALVSGWFFGFAYFFGSTYWIYYSVHDYGNAHVIVAVFITLLLPAVAALYTAALAYCVWHTRKAPALLRVFLLPSLWFVFEWLRGDLFSSFAWNLLGQSLIESPFAGVFPIVGVYGAGWLIVFAGALGAELCVRLPSPHPEPVEGSRGASTSSATARTSSATRHARSLSLSKGAHLPSPYPEFVRAVLRQAQHTRARQRGAAPAVIAIVVAMVALIVATSMSARIEWTHAHGQPIQVAVAQGNIPQSVRFEPEYARLAVQWYRQTVKETPADTLLVWPEAAIPAVYEDIKEQYFDPLLEELAQKGSALMAGAWTYADDESRQAYNSLVYSDGADRHFYHKRHLVPFGEYVPLQFLFDWFRHFVVIPMSALRAGDAPPLIPVKGLQVGVSICYEATLTERVADSMPAAHYFINVSNDGWFGDSFAPMQHVNMARIRAMEFGRPMIRATTTGISAIIGHRGSVLWRSEQFVEHLHIGDIQPRRGGTPYAVLGKIPIFIIVAAVFACLIGWWRRAGQDNR